MRDGLVLNFSDRTFAELCREALHVDIDDSRWDVQAVGGGIRSTTAHPDHTGRANS